VLSSSFSRAHTFLTRVERETRTVGIVLQRPERCARDFAGLNFAWLTEIATGSVDATARGKVAHVGADGAIVLQTMPGATPKVVRCGNATAAVALLSGNRRGSFVLHGPDARCILVSFVVSNRQVSQSWRFSPTACAEIAWHGRTVLRCNLLNNYAVVHGPLPAGTTPEMARRELAGADLGAKLAVLTKSSAGPVEVAFYNAGGAHGSLPQTGIATIGLLRKLSSSIAALVASGTVAYRTKSGLVTAPLPEIHVEADGSVAVQMPAVEVVTTPLHMEAAT
jgi:hypothetical protein